MSRKCYLVFQTNEQLNGAKNALKDIPGVMDVVFVRKKDMMATWDDLARHEEMGTHMLLDYSIPIWNHRACEALYSLIKKPFLFCVSPELSEREVEELYLALDKPWKECMVRPVYGRVGMMRTKNCIKKTTGHCNQKEEFIYIRDRKGARLPVYSDCSSCSNVIYNSVPLSLHSLWEDPSGKSHLSDMPICVSFSDETLEEAEKILSYFLLLEAGKEVKRPYEQFTSAHKKAPVL